MRLAMIAISFMLGLGYVTHYSGLDAVLGLAFTRTGWLYPFFGTFLGWLGVGLAGSATSANASLAVCRESLLNNSASTRF
jgi:lactate permease